MRVSSRGPKVLVVLVALWSVGATASATWLTGCDTSHVDSNDHMNEGIRHYNNNQVSKALDELKEAVRIYPENHRAYYQLGVIYHERMKSFDEAIAAFSEAAKLRPDNSKYRYQLGDSHMFAALKAREDKDNARAREHFRKALEAFKQTVEIDKYYVEAWYNLGRVHQELGEISQAIDAFSNAIQANQRFPLAYAELGNLYAEYAYLDEAAQVLRNGVANVPDDVKLRGALGNVYLEKESYLEAIDHFDKAFKIHDQKKGDKKDILPSYYGRAIAHEKLGTRAMMDSNLAEAVKQFDEAWGYYKVFADNATDESLHSRRMQAGAAMSQIKGWQAELEKGKLPQAIVDQREMLEQRAPR